MQTVWLTRTWRVVAYQERPEARPSLYIALFPECLMAGYEAACPVLEEWRLTHRHARDASILAGYEQHPVWAGKAIIVDEPDGRPLDAVAQRLDTALAGRGLSGPPAITGAKPYGGQSGLIFIRRDLGASPSGSGPDSHRQRLSQLLNT